VTTLLGVGRASSSESAAGELSESPFSSSSLLSLSLSLSLVIVIVF